MTEWAAAISADDRSEFASRSWPAYTRYLAPLRAEVHRWLAPLALPGETGNDVVRAVNEAARNCVEHAYTQASTTATIGLTFWTECGSVWFQIVDHGVWRPPAGGPAARDSGIEIMQRIMPVVLIHYDSRGTRVLLSHPLPPPPRTAGDPAGRGRVR